MAVLELDSRGVLVACPSCGKTNRIAFAALDRKGRCGSCRTELPSAGLPVEAPTSAAFDALLAASAVPVVVDFWAPWCGPCRVVAPELEKVARDAAGTLLVVKVNTDALPDLGERFRVRSIPTMAVFKDGRELARTAGARPADGIRAFVRDALLRAPASSHSPAN